MLVNHSGRVCVTCGTDCFGTRCKECFFKRRGTRVNDMRRNRHKKDG